MPSDLVLKSMNAFHRVLMTVSFGKLGWRAWDMPVVELTTIGRKSGQSRAVLLTSPLQEGSTMVVVASRGGDDVNPAWFLNVRDNPEVQVSLEGGPKQPWTARVASPEQRARMWPIITAAHKNYADYQRRTDREIPLVLLDPR
jgi:deazaflavin-dependent oxidoreductase (nitroreductase family)